MAAELLTGAVLGFLIAALGGGGGLFAVPILVFGFHEPVATATGTSLVIILSAALAGVYGHWRRGMIRPRVVLLFGVASMAGAFLGARLHHVVTERTALTAYAALLFVVSVRMALGRRGAEPEHPRERPAVLIGLGAMVGLVAGFLGVGGGVLIVPALMFGAGLPLAHAVGTSVAVIAMTTSSGSVAHLVEGNVSWRSALGMGGGAMLGALAGSPLSGRLPEKPVRLGFAGLVLIAAVYTLWRAQEA